MLRDLFVRTNRRSVVEAGMHTGLADVADLLHLRDHRVRVEDVVRMHPDRGRNVRARLLLLILGVKKGKRDVRRAKNPSWDDDLDMY